jgi:hypothetical protein
MLRIHISKMRKRRMFLELTANNWFPGLHNPGGGIREKRKYNITEAFTANRSVSPLLGSFDSE